MQNSALVPIPCDVADWFAYPALTSNQNVDSKNITIPNAFGNASGYITLQPDHYFAFCGFSAQTNYDNFGGVFASANANAIIGQPSVPNTFEIEMQRSSQNNFANVRLTQAEVASSGMLSGKQNPMPVIYDPSITFSFKFYDLTGLTRLTQADAAVSLIIQFWMIGYSIPKTSDGSADSNLRRFLTYFPAVKRAVGF